MSAVRLFMARVLDLIDDALWPPGFGVTDVAQWRTRAADRIHGIAEALRQ